MAAAGISALFTVQGLRRTFNDLTRRAQVDPIAIRSITGHVTEDMREHYSTVNLDEKRRAVAAVVQRIRLFPETVDSTVDSGTETKEGRQVHFLAARLHGCFFGAG